MVISHEVVSANKPGRIKGRAGQRRKAKWSVEDDDEELTFFRKDKDENEAFSRAVTTEEDDGDDDFLLGSSPLFCERILAGGRKP